MNPVPEEFWEATNLQTLIEGLPTDASSSRLEKHILQRFLQVVQAHNNRLVRLEKQEQVLVQRPPSGYRDELPITESPTTVDPLDVQADLIEARTRALSLLATRLVLEDLTLVARYFESVAPREKSEALSWMRAQVARLDTSTSAKQALRSSAAGLGRAQSSSESRKSLNIMGGEVDIKAVLPDPSDS